MIKNWETTLSSLPALFTACFSVYNAIKNGMQPSKEEWEIIGASVSAFLIGLNAKDKNVTGGTIPQTPEAIVRVEKPQVITDAVFPIPAPRPRQ